MLIPSRNALPMAAAALMFLVSGTSLANAATDDGRIKSALDNAYAKVLKAKGGKNADYIPALAKVDSNIFGIALVTVDGHVYTTGDVKSEVSIQSISKVFTLALVMEQQGPDAIDKNIGVDATGMAFNSIVAIEQYKGAEMNPLVNPGAIAATSMVKGDTRPAVWNSILSYYSDFAGRPLKVNAEVFKSESETNQRNQAIAALMYAYGHIKDNPARATDIYTEQCAVSVNAKDLAIMAATLANGGKNPVTGKVRHEGRECAGSARGDGDGRPLRRFRQVALQDRPSGQERRWRRHHRRRARQVRHRLDLAAARLPPATATRRSLRSRKSTRLSAPIPMR